MQINKTRDWIERVAWTAFQAAVATFVATGLDDWQLTAKIAGGAALIAALKVIAAQQLGENGGGDAIPGGVEA